MRATYENCNCVQYYMPPFYPNATICGARHLLCINNLLIADSSVLKSEFQCGCLPTCSSLAYTASVSSSPLKKNVSPLIPTEYAVNDIALVKVFLATSSIRGYSRRELATFTETLGELDGERVRCGEN